MPRRQKASDGPRHWTTKLRASFGARQVHLPANRLYAGRRDMVVLRVDPRLLGDPVRWEPGVATDPDSMTFPHLYGPLPTAAVTSVTAYVPDADGRFAEWAHSDT